MFGDLLGEAEHSCGRVGTDSSGWLRSNLHFELEDAVFMIFKRWGDKMLEG